MSTPRTEFAAVALPSGRVLLIGGKSSSTTDTATVDIFDPLTNAVTAGAPMSTARNGHSATLLPNGKVLVAGGDSGPTGAAPTLASAELYDPTTDTWTAAAPMSQPRAHHASVLMSNGKVFVTGGDGGFQSPTPTGSEIYDPGTNTWSGAPTNYGVRPNGPVAIDLKDGRVLVYGGVQQVEPGNSYEFYNPATGLASYGRFIGPASTNFSTGVMLGDGTVLIAGGQQSYNPTGPLSATSIFDPTLDNGICTGSCNTESWSVGPVMNVGHCNQTMTTLRTGLLLVAGGRCGTSESIAIAELYDPAGKRWWPAATMQNARGYHVAALLSDGRVLVAGGYAAGGAITATIEIYTPA